MNSQFEMSTKGKINFFLGQNIRQCHEGIFINQENQTKNLLDIFGMTNCSDAKVPVACGTRVSPSLDKHVVDLKTY